MENVRKRSSGISSNGLRTWGMFFLLAGMLGKSILQNGLLNLGAVSFGQLLEQMQTPAQHAVGKRSSAFTLSSGGRRLRPSNTKSCFCCRIRSFRQSK